MQTVTNIYLIKDLARLSGHSVHTLKFYLKLGLIKESGKTPQTRFRFFDDSTVGRLSQIRAWRKQQKSLADIQQLLRTSDSSGFGAEGSGQLPTAQSPQPRAAL